MTVCGHCGRTSHGMACCGMLAAEAGEVCAIDHFADSPSQAGEGREDGPRPQRQHGPTPLRRPVRRIDPRGTR